MNMLVDRAADLLFPETGGGPRTLNVKFLSAGDEGVSVSDLAQQIITATEQVRDNTARLVQNID